MRHTLPLELYAVRNKEGKWFRAKGYGGYGETWVDDINQAKFYAKIGQARSRVTFFANEYPTFGIPDLVKLTVTKMEVMNEGTRVKKAIQTKKEQEIKSKINRLKWEIMDKSGRRSTLENELRLLEEQFKKLQK